MNEAGTENKSGRKRRVAVLFVIGILCVCPFVFYASCTSTSSRGRKLVGKAFAEMALKDGTYEGHSFKFPGKMKVLVKVDAGKVVEIEVTKQIGLQKYTDVLDPFIASVVAEQTTAVDDVTGATISSRALRRAIDDAVGLAVGETSTE